MQWCYTKLDYKHVYYPTIGVTFVSLYNQKSQKKLYLIQLQIVDVEPIKYSRSTCIFCGWVLLAENLLRLRLNFAANYIIIKIFLKIQKTCDCIQKLCNFMRKTYRKHAKNCNASINESLQFLACFLYVFRMFFVCDRTFSVCFLDFFFS